MSVCKLKSWPEHRQALWMLPSPLKRQLSWSMSCQMLRNWICLWCWLAPWRPLDFWPESKDNLCQWTHCCNAENLYLQKTVLRGNLQMNGTYPGMQLFHDCILASAQLLLKLLETIFSDSLDLIQLCTLMAEKRSIIKACRLSAR